MYYGDQAGDIYGVPSTEFPIDLLERMHLGKIIACAKNDDRLSDIIAAKIPELKVSEIRAIKELDRGVADKNPAIIMEYNKFIAKHRDQINSKYKYHYRRDYIVWEWLDAHNSQIESKRWLEGKDSGITDKDIDFSLFYKTFPEETSNKMNEIMTKVEQGYTYGLARDFPKMVATMPENKIPSYFPRIEKLKPSDRVNMLSNPNTPEKYYDKALRSVGKNGSAPKVKMPVDLVHLKNLPPITRLNVLETLLANNSLDDEFYTSMKEEDFTELFFTSMIRYPDRVERVVDRFRKKNKQIDNNLQTYLLNNAKKDK